MNDALLIFLGATAASFLPMYWLIGGLVRLRQRTAGTRGVAPRSSAAHRHDFIELLRREAVVRVGATIDAALAEARSAAIENGASRLVMPQSARERLREASRLIGTLFPHETQAAFDLLVDEIASRRLADVDSARAAISSDLDRLLLAPRPSSTRNAARRGWMPVMTRTLATRPA